MSALNKFDGVIPNSVASAYSTNGNNEPVKGLSLDELKPNPTRNYTFYNPWKEIDSGLVTKAIPRNIQIGLAIVVLAIIGIVLFRKKKR